MNKCEHESASGIDQYFGPGKVWECDSCGWLFQSVTQDDGIVVQNVAVAQWRLRNHLEITHHIGMDMEYRNEVLQAVHEVLHVANLPKEIH